MRGERCPKGSVSSPSGESIAGSSGVVGSKERTGTGRHGVAPRLSRDPFHGPSSRSTRLSSTAEDCHGSQSSGPPVSTGEHGKQRRAPGESRCLSFELLLGVVTG